MPRLPSRELEQALLDAFSQSQAVAVLVSPSGRNPRRLIVQAGDASLDVWAYFWTLTHGGGPARPRDEYRIQLTGVTSPLQINPTGNTLLLGYEPGLATFAGFDLRRHRRFTPGSPSIQININALRNALTAGLDFNRKSNNEIAVAVRPDQLLTYAINGPLLHAQGPNPTVLRLLARATTLQRIPRRALQRIGAERRRLVTTITRLSRDAQFRRSVLSAYDHRCAVTGLQLGLVDAAHILPVGVRGSGDEVSNGICLTPTYHRAFDRGLVYLDEQLVMHANETQVAQLMALGRTRGLPDFAMVLERRILLPADRASWPDTRFIRAANRARGIR